MLSWNRTVCRLGRELFAGRMLGLGLVFAAARAALAIRATLTAGTAATRAAHAPGWAHLFQLLELLGRQDLLQLRLHLSLQGRHLLLLIVGQVQLFLCARRQQVKPARSTPTTWTSGTAFAARRTLPLWRLITVLRCQEAR